MRRALKELQLTPTATAGSRINKAEQKRLVSAAVDELLLLVRKRAAYELLIEKVEGLHGHIWQLFASSNPKAKNARKRG